MEPLTTYGQLDHGQPDPLLSGHLEPLPHMQPLAKELEAVVASLMEDIDNLRAMIGLPPLGPTRKFTTEDIARGRALRPSSRFENESVLVIRLES